MLCLATYEFATNTKLPTVKEAFKNTYDVVQEANNMRTEGNLRERGPGIMYRFVTRNRIGIFLLQLGLFMGAMILSEGFQNPLLALYVFVAGLIVMFISNVSKIVPNLLPLLTPFFQRGEDADKEDEDGGKNESNKDAIDDAVKKLKEIGDKRTPRLRGSEDKIVPYNPKAVEWNHVYDWFTKNKGIQWDKLRDTTLSSAQLRPVTNAVNASIPFAFDPSIYDTVANNFNLVGKNDEIQLDILDGQMTGLMMEHNLNYDQAKYVMFAVLSGFLMKKFLKGPSNKALASAQKQTEKAMAKLTKIYGKSKNTYPGLQDLVIQTSIRTAHIFDQVQRRGIGAGHALYELSVFSVYNPEGKNVRKDISKVFTEIVDRGGPIATRSIRRAAVIITDAGETVKGNVFTESNKDVFVKHFTSLAGVVKGTASRFYNAFFGAAESGNTTQECEKEADLAVRPEALTEAVEKIEENDNFKGGGIPEQDAEETLPEENNEPGWSRKRLEQMDDWKQKEEQVVTDLYKEFFGRDYDKKVFLGEKMGSTKNNLCYMRF